MKLRKWLPLLLLFTMCISTMNPLVYAKPAPGIRIMLDGHEVSGDAAPYIAPGTGVTLVPLRVVSENLGAQVTWIPSTQSVQIRRSDLSITMRIGQKIAIVNDKSVSLDTSVRKKRGTTLVPLRFIAEQLGLLVSWDPTTQTITLQRVLHPVGFGFANNQPMRGAWVTTVFNLDWPSSGSYGDHVKQQQEYATLLDDLQSIGVNSVFVQIRPIADALYPSKLVPWSKVLTGTQGKDPGYDPLAMMIEETHQRGIEFHAWFNPFRANTDSNTAGLAANHVVKLHPDWIVKSGNLLYINPGIPAARQHIIDAVMEVVNHYAIDGVHLDDYFYPDSGTFDDDATFSTYNSKGLATKADWRRDNINQFVQQLGQSIHGAKPQICYGISPYGIWRNKAQDDTGSETLASMSAYDTMYADVRTWIKQGWIDYVVPQIYWSFTFTKAPYDKLVDWWSAEVKGTNVQLFIGHAPYKLGTAEAGWQTAQEIIEQLDYNKQHPEVRGDVFFSAKDLRANPLGITKLLRPYYQD